LVDHARNEASISAEFGTLMSCVSAVQVNATSGTDVLWMGGPTAVRPQSLTGRLTD